MTYRDTARAYVQAESNNHPAHGGQGAEILPMSWEAERSRSDMTPQTIAVNHAMHVNSAAYELRGILDYHAKDAGMVTDAEMAGLIAERARALLAAIGEAE